MAIGLIVVFTWRLLGWEQLIYEGLPGILMGLAFLFLNTIRAKIKSG